MFLELPRFQPPSCMVQVGQRGDGALGRYSHVQVHMPSDHVEVEKQCLAVADYPNQGSHVAGQGRLANPSLGTPDYPYSPSESHRGYGLRDIGRKPHKPTGLRTSLHHLGQPRRHRVGKDVDRLLAHRRPQHVDRARSSKLARPVARGRHQSNHDHCPGLPAQPRNQVVGIVAHMRADDDNRYPQLLNILFQRCRIIPKGYHVYATRVARRQ